MEHTLLRAQSYIENNRHKVVTTFRPKYHGCPPIGWMNDPNGVIYFNHQYHVFYQFHPYSASWGPMHWGHFISDDLVTFKDAPVALAPDLFEESGCFSGGAIVDDHKQLVLMYTQHYENGQIRERQNIATSVDGINFSKHPTSVITEDDIPEGSAKSDFRDPRPIKIGDDYFVLVGSKSTDNIGQILVYHSKNLRDFTYHFTIGPDVRFGVMGECPDLFHLDGKDVLLLSGIHVKPKGKEFHKVNSSMALIGHFDLVKKTYHIDNIHEIDLGHDFYAPQTLLDPDGKRIMIGWMNMWAKPYFTSVHHHHWSGSLTLPRELSVINHRLYQKPLANLSKYLGTPIALAKQMTISKWSALQLVCQGRGNWTIRLSHPNDPNDYVELSRIDGFINLDCIHSKLFPQARLISRHRHHQVSIELFLDSSSLELFIDHGRETMTNLVYCDSDTYLMEISDPNQVLSGTVSTLKLGALQ